ncbi:TIM barrel protein [Alteromonas pelagimontana]|uniref:TIM barrel protein n=1 Tax=Alteromonas pelagimontana TaxID=1858656 RepID=A0A6M4MFB8_9ALTE|nr:sugar phosphate isomerase/epimerase family protein [Alteromonas pelagimontana]QJR81350.1 TIM barrel protein [Alteromonas pelagimontana]
MVNSRRNLLKGLAYSGVGLAAFGGTALAQADASKGPLKIKGNINHSVARWTFGDLSIEALCKLVKRIGFSAIDLVGPEDWPVLKRYNIDSSMCNGAELNLEDGWCDKRFHQKLTERYLKHIDLVADAGYRNLICFSGSKRGMSREEGLENAVEGLGQVIPHAEKRGVILQMELLNSRVDHPDYMADISSWGVELCKRLKTDNFKLLYDIYHMQIDEGDIIRTIRENHQYFGHYHTGGVPGRHEIDNSQELYYPAIAKAIRDTGFTGYLAQEFIPTPENKTGRAQSLRNAIAICDV